MRDEEEVKITLDERRKVQLSMLAEFNDYCRDNGLKYSLAFGTLLGAIRHKGFIPWDDDLDLMMPLPDYLYLKEHFHSENMRICDVDTEPYYDFIFPRLADKGSFRFRGMINNRVYGINIDLYIMIGFPNNYSDYYWNRVKRIHKMGIWAYKWETRFVRYLPVKSFFLFRWYLKKWRDFLYFNAPYNKDNWYFLIEGLHTKEHVFENDIFESIIPVTFEGHEYSAISCYDAFLRRFYNDYMQLPPVEERVPYHGGVYYKNQ